MRAGTRAQIISRRLHGPGFFIGPLRGQGVEYVGYRDDATTQWNRLTRQPLRVARTIKFFVVAVGNFGPRLQHPRLAVTQQFIAVSGMAFHDLKFVRL